MRIFKSKVFIAIISLILIWLMLCLLAPQLLIKVDVTGVAGDGTIEYSVINLSAWPSNKTAPVNPDVSRLEKVSESGTWEHVPAVYDEGFLFHDIGINRLLPVIKWSNSTVAEEPLLQGETYRLTIILEKGNNTIEVSDEFVA